MKFLSRLLVAFAVLFSLTVAQIIPVKASSAQDLSPTAAESYLRTALLATGDADLRDSFPNPQDRVIRGAYILQLWNDPDIQKLTEFNIHYAIIDGNIEGSGINLPFNVEFHNSIFNGDINLASATTKTFRIDDSTVNGAVKMGRMIVSGDLALYQSVFSGEVTLFGADVTKNLFAKGSHFNGAIPDKDSAYPFELWTTHVGQTTEFTDATFKGEVKVDDAKFDVNVTFDNAVFEKPASFVNIDVGKVASFRKAWFKNTVTFQSSIFERDAEFSEALFYGTANFDYISVARFFDFDHTVVNNKFSLQYSTVGWPYFEGASFNGLVNFEGIQASNDLDFTNASYNYWEEPFTIKLAKVDGSVKFPGFIAPAGMSLDHDQFGALAITNTEDAQTQKYAFINLDATVINGDLSLDSFTVRNLSAKGLAVNGRTTLTYLVISESLDMSNAHLGLLSMSDAGFWPKPTAQSYHSNLRGMVYNDIGLVKLSDPPNKDSKFADKELDDNSVKTLQDMVGQSDYSPEAYRTLEDFLTEKGHPEWAAKVEKDRKVRERKEILYPHNKGLWLWSWFLFLFSGYGQIPALALGWSLLVILIGAFVYWDKKKLKPRDEHVPAYNSFLYSFALFVPFIELDYAEKWDPRPGYRFGWYYRYVHKILGWILTPIALLTFGGIIK